MRKDTADMIQSVHRIYQGVQLLKTEDKVVDASRLQDLADNWKDDHIPLLQRQVVDAQLENLRQGVIDPVFLTFQKALRSVKLERFSFLDIGCASGHYCEVMRILDKRNISYKGCDYSAAMIDCARQCYPDTDFEIQDVASLGYPDNAFDVVMASGVLQYIFDYHRAIDSVLRVARHYAIFHRLPVIRAQENECVEGTQYSIVTARTRFSRKRIIQEIRNRGFSLVQELKIRTVGSHAAEVKRVVKRILRAPETKRGVETLVFKRIGN